MEILITRIHSSRMCTARLPTIGDSMATTRYQYWGSGGIGPMVKGVGHRFHVGGGCRVYVWG